MMKTWFSDFSAADLGSSFLGAAHSVHLLSSIQDFVVDVYSSSSWAYAIKKISFLSF